MIPRILLILIILIAGCANRESEKSLFEPYSSNWHGRFALSIEGENPHNTSASFYLRGNAVQGEMTVFSPIGSTVAVISWTPEYATFVSNGRTEYRADLDALTRRLTGTNLPVAAFFSWFEGKAAEADGWTVNLDRLGDGHLSAVRTLPSPKASVRIVLDR